jgi:hypothetical protein
MYGERLSRIKTMAERRASWDYHDVFSREVNEMENAFSSDMVI